LGLLDRDELRAVLGHEMGHIKHNDMIVTAAVSVIPMICYYIALSFMFSGDSRNGGGIIIGILGYLFYLIGQVLVLFISRTREYYADQASVEYGNHPASLVSALYKLSYGAARCSKETIDEVNTNRAFFVNDVNNARNDITDFQQIDFDGDGKISEEELKRLLNSDVKISRKNGIMELLSTHPDSLKRVKRLAEMEA
jgi:heat shock protein HtpX